MDGADETDAAGPAHIRGEMDDYNATHDVPAAPAGGALQLLDLRRRYGDRVALDGLTFTVTARPGLRLSGPQRRGKDDRHARRGRRGRPGRRPGPLARRARGRAKPRRAFGYMPEDVASTPA